MSARQAAVGPTRTLPARAPDGFWRGNKRYFWYVLFAGTGLVLTLAAVVLLFALGALGASFTAWRSALGVLASPPVLLINAALWVGILYFAIRFLWVGVKIPSVSLGRMPAPPPPLILVAHFGGFVTLFLALLLVFSGAVK